jgi:hypothetical protein
MAKSTKTPTKIPVTKLGEPPYIYIETPSKKPPENPVTQAIKNQFLEPHIAKINANKIVTPHKIKPRHGAKPTMNIRISMLCTFTSTVNIVNCLGCKASPKTSEPYKILPNKVDL